MWSVDRIENGIAILEDDNRTRREVPLFQLPADVKEGDVLVEQDGKYLVDQKETSRRREQIFQLQQRLFRKK